jgi:tetratricopeptide (TPR) repeat protein
MTDADRLRRGLEYHRQGRLAEAEAEYEAVLAAWPEHAEALHLLGVVAHQRGEHARAVEIIDRAIGLRPGVPAFHCNLADAQRSLGRLAEAEENCRRALQLQPDYPEARNNLGVIRFAQGRFAEAEEQLREAVRLRPTDARCHNHLADALREQGKIQAAIAGYRQALDLAPRLASAHGNLGLVLLLVGQLLEALEHCRRAVEIQPDSAELHTNLGQCLLALDRFEEALDAYGTALDLDPQSPVLCSNIGEAWQEMGDCPQALTWYERALQHDPAALLTRCRLASALREMDRLEESIDAYRQILREQPEQADAHQGLAQALWDQGDATEAAASYREAIRLRPEWAGLHALLGGVLASAGDMDQAVASHRTALERNPKCGAAWAGLATSLRGRLPEEDRVQIEALLDEPWLGKARRAGLHFGLAQVHDGRGEWARAAGHMVQANALQKAHWSERDQEYDPLEHTRFVDRLLEVFTPAYFERVRGFGLETNRPVFIVGMPRSGTTLTEQVLASHPQIFGAGERKLAFGAFGQLPGVRGRQGPSIDCVADLDRPAVQRLARWHLERLHALDDGRSARITDKLPDNYLLLGWIATLFPDARLIHCRRDVRDVALSCWITNFAQITWAVDLEHIAHRIREYLRVIEHWRRVLPVPMLDVDYEELVADQEGISRRLIEWVGLEWDPACLHFHQTERLIRTASVAQVRQPIYRRSLARWRHYAEMLTPLLARLPLSERGGT